MPPLETLFETRPWPVALGTMFNQAIEMQDLDMLESLIHEMQEVKRNLLDLEDCYNLEA